jgi:nuclear pore complex protein Nup53
VIVFGYPQDKFDATADFFRALGDGASAPEPHAELLNAFRIGYRSGADALRAVRKSGDVLGGAWMVGVKFADPAHAESVLGSALVYGPAGPSAPQAFAGPTPSAGGEPMPMDEDVPPTPGAGALVPTTTVGTPMRLAPPSAAFKKGSPLAPPGTPVAPGALASSSAAAVTSPGKGMLGQVSDLIFGW